MTVVPSLTLVRRIKAPPARVWAAWTRPELLAGWWGPHHTRVETAEVEAHCDCIRRVNHHRKKGRSGWVIARGPKTS